MSKQNFVSSYSTLTYRVGGLVKDVMILGMRTLWCLIEGGWNTRGGWKNPQNLISRGVGKLP